MAPEPVTRYATGSRVHIAYQLVGRGPALVVVPGLTSHLELQWEEAAYRSFIRRLATFTTVVRFDKRGTGLSDPAEGLPSLAERDADLAAVIEAAGVERPILFGYSEGGPIAIRHAVSRQGSIAGLILYGTSAHPPPPWAMERLRAVVEAWGTGASIELFGRSQADDALARANQARFERASASPAMARALVESLLLTDVEALLATIEVPTLVIHRVDDVVPADEARFLASHVRSSRLSLFPGVDHRPWLGNAQAIIDEVERFVGSVAPTRGARPDQHARQRRPARPSSGWESLSERERAVAGLVVAGCSNPEIAARLYISRETVQTHLKHIFGKLGVDSRTALATIAAERFSSENP